jgi:hypothetical protein
MEIILDDCDDKDYHIFDNIDTSPLSSSSQLPAQQSSAIPFNTTGHTAEYTSLFNNINQPSDVSAPSTSGFINLLALADLTIHEDNTLADLTTGMPEENANDERTEDDGMHD